MDLLEARDLSFYYPDQEKPALHHVSFTVNEGDFIVLFGPSGSGKSTLLRLLKPEIAPHGKLEGSLHYSGVPLTDGSHRKLAKEIGMVFQDPENQIVMDRVMDELVFGLENLGTSTAAMRKKVAEIVHFFGLEPLLEQKTHELSGGQKQIVNLASVLLMEPRVLLLDEPTAQLDPVAAKDFIHMLRRMNEELGITVILAEHRLEGVLALADQAIVLEEGVKTHSAPPRNVIGDIIQTQNDRLGDYLPAASALYKAYGKGRSNRSMPLTVKEGQQWVKTLQLTANQDPETRVKPPQGVPLIQVKDIDFQYEKSGRKVLDGLSLSVYEGERMAIVGGNGTGKSTLLKMLTGLLKPQHGSVIYKGQKLKKQPPHNMGYLPQNPKLFFLEDTVEKEMNAAASGLNSKKTINEMLETFQLTELRDRHPYDLSGGEMQKAALACLLLRQPDVIVIDEPTKGLDPQAKRQLSELLVALNEKGLTIITVTHDIEFAARYASRCAMMFQGELTAEDAPKPFFKGNMFYTTAVDRITRAGNVPEVLSVEEALQIWRYRDSPLE